MKANGGGEGELLPTSLLIGQDTQSDCAEIHLGGLTTKLRQKGGDIRKVMERRGIEGGGGKRKCGRREFREEMKRWGRLEGWRSHRGRGVYMALNVKLMIGG